ncbi:MAG: YggT family protein [Thiomicrorhabdus sp.]|jgi:YggT family protein|nr:YggT family protein [Thiomicrorhabdus sp.]
MEMTSPMGQGGLFLLQFVTGLVIFGLMLRFLLRATHADWRHPIVTFIAKITNPLCAPINKVLPLKGRWDWSAIGTAVVIQALFILLVGFLTEKEFSALFILLASITEIMNQLLDMLFWLIIIHVVLSWVAPGQNPNTAIFDQLTNPILEPFKRMIPPIAGMDLSPLAAILAIKLVQIMAVGSVTQIAQKLMG